jgi:hypothetical protein
LHLPFIVPQAGYTSEPLFTSRDKPTPDLFARLDQCDRNPCDSLGTVQLPNCSWSRHIMANNPLSVKSKPAGPAPSLRVTPSNSPSLRPPTRSSTKPSLYQSALSLQTVIGTTTTTPNGFSYHDQSRSFAFCAGSAAVLAELDDNNNANQRFFRARPSTNSINPITSFYNQSTPPATPDARTKSLSSIKTVTYNGINTPSSEAIEAASPRVWSSREKVKAVTSVAISPNGRFLALGEVSKVATLHWNLR